jgi:hypothetical protein
MKSKFLFPVLSSSLLVLSLLSNAHAMDRSHDEKDSDSPVARAAAAVQPAQQQAAASEPQQARAAAAQAAYDPSQFAQRDQVFFQRLRAFVAAAVEKLNVKNEKDFAQRRFSKNVYDRLSNPNGPTRELLRILLLSSRRNSLDLDDDGQQALQGFLQGFTAEYREFVFDPAHKGTQNKDILKAQKDLALMTLDNPANPQRDQQAFDLLEACDPALVEAYEHKYTERDRLPWGGPWDGLKVVPQQDRNGWFVQRLVVVQEPLEDLQFVATMFAFQGRVPMKDDVLAGRLLKDSRRSPSYRYQFSSLSTRYYYQYANTTSEFCLAVMRAEDRVTDEAMGVGKAFELLGNALGNRKKDKDARCFLTPEFDMSRAKTAYEKLRATIGKDKKIADAVAAHKADSEKEEKQRKARYRAAGLDDESDSDDD